MILLQGKTLTRKEVFRPESFQLQLGERDSQATMTVGPDAPEIALGDWMQDDTEPGKGVVWRVKGVDTDYNEETRTITLEHIVQTLKDTVMFGEVTTDTLGGGNARNAVQYILGRTSLWTLGSFGYSVNAPYEFNSENLLDALEEIDSTLPDSVWTYDLSAMPFKLNITKQTSTVSCEMRGGRNVSTIRKSIDRSRMYTRLYPIGADDLHISGNYVQQNTELYGVISKVETDQAYDTDAKLRRWATDRLRRHCEPTVTVTISGLELSQETGEPLDRLTVGTMCRVPVPELGTVITERITRLQWRDKIRDPMDVTVTLANNREDVATIFKSQSKTTDKGSKSGARAGGIAKKKTEDAVNGLYTQIIKTEEQIRLEAADTKRELMGSIDVQADRIGLVVEGTGANAKIKPASIVAAINGSSSSVAISADKIMLNGSTAISSLLTGKAAINSLLVYDLRVGSGTGMGAVSAKGAWLSALDLKLDGNTYTLKAFTLDSATPKQTFTFSRATSLKGRWSGGTYTVTATPQNTTNTARIRQLTQSGRVSVIGNYVGQDVSVYATENGGSNSTYTGFKQQVWIDATEVYEAGKRDASHNITPGGAVYVNYSNPGGTQVGSAVNAAFFRSGANYLSFSMSCGGTSKSFYIQITN